MILLCKRETFAQYGLGFAGQEVIQDQRTGLDLNVDGLFCPDHNFELSFDLSFTPNQPDYFGYLVRIVEDDRQSIDLVYDRRLAVDKRFRIINGERFSKIAFEIPEDSLFNVWTNIRIQFDVMNGKLIVFKNGEDYSEMVQLKRSACYKILFGFNDYKKFSTTDVPAMKLKNIVLKEENKPAHTWPLDNMEGTLIKDEQGSLKSMVTNPVWLKKRHQDWQLLKKWKSNGYVNVAFDVKTERAFLVGADSMLVYNLSENRSIVSPYASGHLNLKMGNQSVYDTLSGRLIDFSADQQIVSVFDEAGSKWSRNFDNMLDDTKYWHANKFYWPSTGSLYVVAGYGHFSYKNIIQHYWFGLDKWKDKELTDGNFEPRYLAGLGTGKKGVYLVGGYGSSSGEQMLNPKYYYDFFYYDPLKNKLTKRFEMAVGQEKFVFANSLVIDEGLGQYYGLIFPKNIYNSQLQLIRGSLSDPDYIKVGSPLPFLFNDVHSYADLFYGKRSKRFIAVTLYKDSSNVTVGKIYSLFAPPIPVSQISKSSTVVWWYSWIVLSLGFVGMLIFFVLKKWSTVHPNVLIRGESLPEKSFAPQVTVTQNQPSSPKSAIFLFGNMQMFDKDGNDITKLFTPLIKELFLLILLYSKRREGGVSSDKLIELLWFDKSPENARNNRSVAIARLKTIMEKIGNCQLSKETGYWKLEIDEDEVYVDYWHYLDIVKDKTKLDKQKVMGLSEIVQRGNFLMQSEYVWLDPIKSEISNEIIDSYLHFLNSVDIAEDPDLLIQLANYVFVFDTVNEEAMVIKCRALSHLGKHSLATQVFDNFCREYRQIYGEDFNRDFRAVIQ